jgi:hypothetical protein
MSDVGDASIVGNVPPVPGMFPDWAAPRYWERIKVTVIAPHVATAAYWSTGHQHPATRLRRHSGFADTQKPLPGRSLMRSVSGVVMSVMVATAGSICVNVPAGSVCNRTFASVTLAVAYTLRGFLSSDRF